MSARIVFITGTDTGVGKTLLTALLLARLRQDRWHALAIKPFCTGGRDDVDLLQVLQDGELTRDEINPFYFSQPLAPLVAGRNQGHQIRLEQVLEHIRRVATRSQWLLVEGIGGVCVPLGRRYLVADLIKRLRCETIVVSSNRLGTLHSTLCACFLLKLRGVQKIKVVLMDQKNPDLSAKSNSHVLSEWLAAETISIPYLGPHANRRTSVIKNVKKIKKPLAKLFG